VYPKTADVDVWSKDVPRRQLYDLDETALNWHIISYKWMASMSTADGSKLRGSMNYNSCSCKLYVYNCVNIVS